MVRLLMTLLVGSAGGLLGYKLRLPAGAMIGSMLAVGLYNCIGFLAFMPSQVRIGVQIILGCLLGLNLNRNTFTEFKTMAIPALIIIVSLLLCSVITGFIIYKVCKVDISTAVLSSSPGGMTEMSLLAVTLGVDGTKVAMLHAIRMIVVVSAMPAILHVVANLFQKSN